MKQVGEKPDWWPETPYPEDIFPMTLEEYVEAVPDKKLRSALTGHLARFGWGVASSMIFEAMQEQEASCPHCGADLVEIVGEERG